MKNIFSKKVWLVSVLLISFSAAGYIFIKKAAFGSLPPTETKVQPKKALVDGVGFNDTQDELQKCYENLLSRHSETGDGEVLYHMTITKAGEVDFLKMIQTDFPEDAFLNCLSDKIKASRLPATAERIGVLIAHKYKFKRKDAQALSF